MVDGVNETMKGERLTNFYSELLHWISLWTMMSTVAGTDHRRSNLMTLGKTVGDIAKIDRACLGQWQGVYS